MSRTTRSSNKSSSSQAVPKEFNYTPEKFATAKKNGTIVVVGGPSTTYRKLSKAPKYWDDKKDNFQYVVADDVLIGGTPANIRKALSYGGVSDSRITQALNNSIT